MPKILEKMSEVIILNEGVIIEKGAPSDLLLNHKIYSSLMSVGKKLYFENIAEITPNNEIGITEQKLLTP